MRLRAVELGEAQPCLQGARGLRGGTDSTDRAWLAAVGGRRGCFKELKESLSFWSSRVLGQRRWAWGIQ